LSLSTYEGKHLVRFKKVLGEKLDGVEGFGKRVREKGLGMRDGVEGFEKRFGRRVWEWGMGWKGLRRGSGEGSGNGGWGGRETESLDR
jgi:hypothetical protein